MNVVRGGAPVDEALMAQWFSDAMTVMSDHVRRENAAALEIVMLGIAGKIGQLSHVQNCASNYPGARCDCVVGRAVRIAWSASTES
jgi:hypothetical protein